MYQILSRSDVLKKKVGTRLMKNYIQVLLMKYTDI